MEDIRLNHGAQMPKLGLGVFQTDDEQVRERCLWRRTSMSSVSRCRGETLAAIGALDTGIRGGPDSECFTLEQHSFSIPEAGNQAGLVSWNVGELLAADDVETPEEIANAVLRLRPDVSSFVAGALPVLGGVQTIWRSAGE